MGEATWAVGQKLKSKTHADWPVGTVNWIAGESGNIHVLVPGLGSLAFNPAEMGAEWEPVGTPESTPGACASGKPCGFTHGSSTKWYCSPECRDRAASNHRPCAKCGKPVHGDPRFKQCYECNTWPARELKVRSLDPRDAGHAQERFMKRGMMEPSPPWTCANGKECGTPGAPQHIAVNGPRGVSFKAGTCVVCADRAAADLRDQHDKAAASVPRARPQPGFTMPGEHAELATMGGWRRGWR